jgi:hypothetical protein
MKSTDFIVARHDLQQCKFIESEMPDGDALPDEALLIKIDRFAFTANYITYAVTGDRLKRLAAFPGAGEFRQHSGVGIWRGDRLASSKHFRGRAPVRLLSDGDASGDRGGRCQQAGPARRHHASARGGTGPRWIDGCRSSTAAARGR